MHLSKMNIRNSILGLATVLCLASCGTFLGEGDNSDGVSNVGDDDYTVSFDVTQGQTNFTSFPFTNTTSGTVTLSNLNFENNLCNAFSFFNITNPDGVVLVKAGHPLNTLVESGKTVNVAVRFDPINCVYKNYDSILKVYFTTADSEIRLVAYRLRSLGSKTTGGSEENTTCDENTVPAEYTRQYVSSIPDPGKYHMQITRMRAFILPTKADDQRVLFGTDIGVDPNLFVNPHIPIEMTANQTFTLQPITICDEFVVPSASSDRFFRGADTTITAKNPTPGKIIRDTTIRETHLELDGLTIKLRADNIDDSSLIPDPNGTFQVTLKVDKLTTGESDPSPFLGDMLQNEPIFKEKKAKEGKDPFNLVNKGNATFALKGQPLTDGKLVLVGTGLFNNTENNFIGDTETAKTFLVDNPAYIFIQLEATLTKKEEGE